MDSSSRWEGTPDDLSDFLKTCPKIKPETVQLLNEQEVDVDSFRTLTEDTLLKYFPTLTFGQKKELMHLSSNLSNEVEKLQPLFSSDNNSHPKSSVKVAAENIQESSGTLRDEDLGCFPLPNDGTKPVGGLTDFSTPATSFSINKRQSAPNQPLNKKSKQDIPVKDSEVAPLNILELLNCERGRKLIASVRETKAMSNSDQIFMMERIYNSVTQDRASPFKNYPETNLKIAIAKGIVTDFPELKSDGDCEWSAWLTVTITKFQTVRRKNGQRKNNKQVSSSALGSQPQNTSRKRKSSSSSTATSTAVCSPSTSKGTMDELSILTASLKRYMDGALPNSQNRSQISTSLASTFEARRSWINSVENTPSCAAIVHDYKHLQSYGGDMLLEEFSRMEPLEEDFVAKFEKVAPLIGKHAQSCKPALFHDVFDKFGHNVNLVALLLLPKLLPTSLNQKTATAEELAHMKKYKIFFEQIPSSSFLQVVPEGTDVATHMSLESSKGREAPTPVFPYLLWLTNDFKSGQFFMKIDSVSFLVSAYPSEKDPVMRAVDMLLKAYFVFNLKYHPYLHTVFNFFEVLSGICDKPRTTVEKFQNTLRELAKK